MESEQVEAIVDIAATLAARADEFDMVLVICQKKKGGGYSADNGLTVSDALFLIETFRHWLMIGIHSKEDDDVGSDRAEG